MFNQGVATAYLAKYSRAGWVVFLPGHGGNDFAITEEISVWVYVISGDRFTFTGDCSCCQGGTAATTGSVTLWPGWTPFVLTAPSSGPLYANDAALWANALGINLTYLAHWGGNGWEIFSSQYPNNNFELHPRSEYWAYSTSGTGSVDYPIACDCCPGPTGSPTPSPTVTPVPPTATPSPTACPNDTLANNSCATAYSLTSLVPVNNLFICSQEEDFFRFTLPSTANVIINATFIHALGDLDMFVYSGDCNTLNEIARGYTQTDNESVTLIGLGAGTYTVKISGFRTSVNSYSIDLDAFVLPTITPGGPTDTPSPTDSPTPVPTSTFTPSSTPTPCTDDLYEPNQSCAEAPLLGNGTYDLVLCGGDDWFTIEVTEATDLNIVFVPLNPAGGASILFYRDASCEIDTFYDGAFGTVGAIRSLFMANVQPGLYRLLIEPVNTIGIDYELTIAGARNPGWVPYPTPATSIRPPFFEDFEAGLGAWTITTRGTGDYNLTSLPCNAAPFDRYSFEVFSSVDGTDGEVLLSVSFDLMNVNSAFLQFNWMASQLFEGVDYIALDVFDGTWHYDVRGIAGNTIWVPETVDLKSFQTSGPITVQFRSRVNFGNCTDGFFLDNVGIISFIPPTDTPTQTPSPTNTATPLVSPTPGAIGFLEDWEDGNGNDWAAYVSGEPQAILVTSDQMCSESTLGTYSLQVDSATDGVASEFALQREFNLTNATGPVYLIFWWKSEANEDIGSFSLSDGTAHLDIATITGNAPWTRVVVDLTQFDLSAGSILCEWYFAMDFGGCTDGFYLDNIEIRSDIPSTPTPTSTPTLPPTRTPSPTPTAGLCLSDDRLEPNDSCAQAAVPLLQTETALRLCPFSEDWYTFDISTGEVLTVSTRSRNTTVGTRLTVFADDCSTQITTAAGSSVFTTVSAGSSTDRSLFVRVTSQDNLAFDYNLTFSLVLVGTPTPTPTQTPTPSPTATFTACPGDNLEPNDTCDTATLVQNGWYRGLTACPNNSDFFDIKLLAQESVIFKAHFIDANGDLDMRLVEYPECTTVLASATSTTDNEQITFLAPHAGDFVAEVFGYQGGSNTYDLQVVYAPGTATPTFTPSPTATPTLCAPDRLEPNDVCGASALLAPGSYNGLTICSGDTDHHTVNVPAGSQIIARITFNNSLGDLDMRLYDTTACTVSVASSAGISNVETFSYTSVAGGVYDVSVEGYNGAANDYNLSISVGTPVTPTPTATPFCTNDQYEPNDECATAPDVAPGVYQGQICFGESDFFHVSVPSSNGITAQIAFTDANGDLDLYLYDASDCLYTIASSEGITDIEIVSAQPGSAAEYVVEVYGYLGSSNSYTLTITTN